MGPAASNSRAQVLNLSIARSLSVACCIWLVVALVSTVIGVANRWPAQFGGAGQASEIGTQWMTKGTVLSPPLFLLVAMAGALGLLVAARWRAAKIVGAGLATLIGAIGFVGALGEVLAAATPEVPREAQMSAIIGVVLSLVVVITGIITMRSLLKRSTDVSGTGS